jgi:hypothetical protein
MWGIFCLYENYLYLCGMEKVCNTCNTAKPASDFRNRNQCKTCENKIRYQKNKIRKQTDPEFASWCRSFDVQRKRRKEKEDPMTGFIQIMRQCVRKSFTRKGYTKKSKVHTILGTDWSVVKSHMESLFKEGMTWDNHGEWHIDHIIPISSGKTEDEVVKLCHHTNLQPLWAEENLLKSNKI